MEQPEAECTRGCGKPPESEEGSRFSHGPPLPPMSQNSPTSVLAIHAYLPYSSYKAGAGELVTLSLFPKGWSRKPFPGRLQYGAEPLCQVLKMSPRVLSLGSAQLPRLLRPGLG